MQVSAWFGGPGTYGIRIGEPNRDKYFDHEWKTIQVDIDGCFHEFKLTPGFWNRCPEFRDSGGTIIRDWLHSHRTLDWPKGHPPKFELLPIGCGRFRVIG